MKIFKWNVAKNLHSVTIFWFTGIFGNNPYIRFNVQNY